MLHAPPSMLAARSSLRQKSPSNPGNPSNSAPILFCRDNPMMYEGGWGKKLTYIISCSCFETVDVTRRYTSKWQEVLQRRLEVPELWLSRTLAQLNTQMQFQMMLPDYLHREHEARRSSEAQQLLEMHPQARASQPLSRYVFVA